MTTFPSPSRTVVRARVGVSVLFVVNGALFATVLPRLPAIKAALDLSNGELGIAAAGGAVGGVLAGGFAGALIHRAGSGRLAVALGLANAALLPAIGLAPSWALLVATFMLLGMCDAGMDAAMNTHGIVVQRRFGRSILHAFHGWWSAGTLAGGGAGALAAAANVPVVVHLAVAGAVLAVALMSASRLLLPDPDTEGAAPGAVDLAPLEPIHPRNAPRLVRLLGPLALLGALGVMLEDAAQTWSTVYLVDVLGLRAGPAAVAFVLYTVAMTVGRLTNDRWIDRWGAANVSRLGALVAAVGLVLVAAAAGVHDALPAFVGFVAVGLGASPLFPGMVDAAAHRPGVPAAHGVALVAWLARVGSVLAPSLVGLAADAVGLAAAFAIPLAAALTVAALAPVLMRPPAGAPAPVPAADRGA